MSRPQTSKTLIAIPARWGSTRFPGKPLHPLAGKPMIQHVWERCCQAKQADEVVIATDDPRIVEAADSFGAKAVLTRDDHPSGTDRIAEAAEAFPECTQVINVQGDEPLISPQLIDRLALEMREHPEVRMITAAAPLTDPAQIADPNIVKVLFDLQGDSLYFSRSPLPHVRQALPGFNSWRHLGIYGFERRFLHEFVSWPPGALERVESLEQLRALERGVRLRVLTCDDLSPGVDTPEQAAAIDAQLRRANGSL